MTAPPPVDGPAISTHGLTKHFGPIVALDRLDLVVPAGSIFGLLGPNGAGKTTTIRILSGLARPTSGTALVAGADVGLDRARLRRLLGYVAQEPRFYSWMTGRELLELIGRLYGLEDPELRGRVDETLDRVGLTDAAGRRIGGYSSGMRQRLGIGGALLPRPGILFLDEPVSSLDPAGRRDVLELVAGLRGTATVVFSTHILADVERICDRVAILDRGRLVAEAPLAELLSSHVRPTYRLVPAPGQAQLVPGLKDRLTGAPWAGAVQPDAESIRLSVTDEDAAKAEILPLVVASGVVLDAFERVQPTLEDVFLELVAPPRAEELDGRGFVRPREVRDEADAGRPPASTGSPAPAGRVSRDGPRPVRGAVAPDRPLIGLGVLVRKELVEQWRTLRLPIVTMVFLLVGLSSPLLARFAPDILRAVGGDQFLIELPTPTAADAVGQLLKNLGQFGALTAVVLAMGAVATEKERGTAALVLSKPASRAAFLVAKLVAIAATLGVATVVAAAGAWFYTLVLFEARPIAGFAALAGLQWLQLVAFAAITFLGSTLTRSAVAAAGVGLAGFVILGIVGALPTIGPYLPTGLGTPAAEVALGLPTDPLVGPVIAVVALIAGMTALAWLSFRRQEL
jgi:ABC-2 type transport system ATP-binding protein